VGLSLGSTSLHSFVVDLMSAYDENGDGQLVWAEWLPVAVDLIQTASAAEWAKQASEEQQASYQQRVSERLAGKQQSQLTAEVTALAAELDPSSSGLRPPHARHQRPTARSVGGSSGHAASRPAAQGDAAHHIPPVTRFSAGADSPLCAVSARLGC